MIDGDKLFAACGPQGDRTQFIELIQKNIHLYRLRNGWKTTLETGGEDVKLHSKRVWKIWISGVKLDVKSSASFTRNELATALRKGPYSTNLMIGEN